MSCKYNNCKHCGYKSECEIYKENAELKADNSEWEKTSDKWKSVYELTNNQLTNAKELLKQWLQTSKASGCDNINIVTDTEQFLKGYK